MFEAGEPTDRLDAALEGRHTIERELGADACSFDSSAGRARSPERMHFRDDPS